MYRILVLAFCAALLQACASPPPGGTADNDVSFEERSDQAIVIVGVRSTREPELTGLFWRHKRWTTTWLKFDPASQKAARPFRTLRAFRTSCSLGDALPVGCNDDHLSTFYFVLDALPGNYILHSLGVEGGGVVSFTSADDSLIFDNSIARNLETNRVPHFSVAPGEIVYIGDYVFDVGEWPAKLLDIERDDAGARRALDDFPNLEGPVEYRGPLQPLELET